MPHSLVAQLGTDRHRGRTPQLGWHSRIPSPGSGTAAGIPTATAVPQWGQARRHCWSHHDGRVLTSSGLGGWGVPVRAVLGGDRSHPRAGRVGKGPPAADARAPSAAAGGRAGGCQTTRPRETGRRGGPAGMGTGTSPAVAWPDAPAPAAPARGPCPLLPAPACSPPMASPARARRCQPSPSPASPPPHQFKPVRRGAGRRGFPLRVGAAGMEPGPGGAPPSPFPGPPARPGRRHGRGTRGDPGAAGGVPALRAAGIAGVSCVPPPASNPPGIARREAAVPAARWARGWRRGGMSLPSPGDRDPGARGVGAVPALRAGLGLRRRGNWQRQAGTAAPGGTPRSPPCQGGVGGLAGCGSLSPRLLAGRGRPWDPPSQLVPLQTVLALPQPLLTGAHRCPTGLGEGRGGHILLVAPSCHCGPPAPGPPPPAGLVAAAKGVPRSGHGCGPRAEASAVVAPSLACGSCGDPGRGLTAVPWHHGSSPTAAPPAPGPLRALPGDTAGAGGTAAGWSPAPSGAAPWVRQHRGDGGTWGPGLGEAVTAG